MAFVGTTVRADLRTGPLLVGLAALATLALWPSVRSLEALWRGIHDYQHGYFIALVSAIWLGFVARREWSAVPQPGHGGLAALALVLLAWLVALSANSQIAHQMLFPVVVWCAVWAGVGLKGARRAAAPIAYLWFAIPLWDYALPLLRRLSIAVTETTLGWLGVSAEVHEYSVSIPGGSFQIIDGCSGKRYFMVTLAVAVLAVALNRIRGRHAWAYVLVCGALALVANWIRILIVIYSGYAYGMQTYLVAVEHRTLGNVIYVALLALVLVLARAFAPKRVPARHRAADPGPAANPLPFAAAAATLLIAAFVMGYPRDARARGEGSPGSLPLATGVWQGPLPAETGWAPKFIGATGERRAAYVSDAGTVELYVNTYGTQRQGSELVQYANTLLAPGHWERAWPHVASPLSPHEPRMASFEARADDGRLWLFAYLFDVGGWQTHREALAQLAYGLQALRGPVDSGLVALAVRCETDCAAARALAAAFWDDMSGPVLAMLAPKGVVR